MIVSGNGDTILSVGLQAGEQIIGAGGVCRLRSVYVNPVTGQCRAAGVIRAIPCDVQLARANGKRNEIRRNGWWDNVRCGGSDPREAVACGVNGIRFARTVGICGVGEAVEGVVGVGDGGGVKIGYNQKNDCAL